MHLQSKRSFTLIEILIAMLLISIISTFSISFYSKFLIQNDLANTVDLLIGDLRKAQMYSIMSKQNSKWGVNYTNNKITLFKGDTYGEDHTFDEVYNVNPNIIISGFTEIVFTRINGTPNTTPIITIDGQLNDIRTITINEQGVVNRQ